MQDAAQRSAVTEVRNTQSVVQKAIYQGIHEMGVIADGDAPSISLENLVDNLPPRLLAELGNDRFTASFIPRDQVWRKAYKSLVVADTEVTDNALLKTHSGALGMVDL